MIEILYFTASWCVPCKNLKPTLDSIFKKYPNISRKLIDIDQYPHLANTSLVKGVPTVIFKKNGIEINRVVGAMPLSHYEHIINSL
jgi:thioredoxin 1